MNTEKISQITTKTFTPPHPLKTAVLFMVFNRPDTTKQVFEAIRKAKPPRLYVSADGPRADKAGEAEKCKEVRRIAMQVDWDCEVKSLFRDQNLGCKVAVSSAIDWFFENEEEGIILEDDCLPSQSFFWFCEELLIKFSDDPRVQHIGGTNPFDTELTTNQYYFSKFNRIWGWASWRRSWNNYNVEIKMWPSIKKENYHKRILGEAVGRYYEKIWDAVYQGKIDTWDYQWMLCRMLQGMAIIPYVNLISNIGFGENSTHTTTNNSKLSNLPRGEIIFPLQHREYFVMDYKKDLCWEKYLLNEPGLISKLLRIFK
ncbi:MAG: hypothetical protein JRG74_10190 [Deltaproteobacteria bacterium]|nr:hypothetical protein [Deltaproteobacteria bacterium]